MWRFEHAGQNQVENEPINEEFFASAESLSEVSALIRESVQNSLDARSDKRLPAVVRFSVGVVGDLDRLAPYFAGLRPHVESALKISGDFLDKPCRFLTVEDFGTTGLLGDVYASRREADEAPKLNGYQFFAWRFGAGGKETDEGARGRWGVGKVVFPRLSRCKTYLSYSVRQINETFDPLVFGQALLRYHDVDDVRLDFSGWWGDVGQGSRFIPRGRNAEVDFVETWNLSRRFDQPGLSVVVPFVSDDVTGAEVLSCLLRDYFVAIADGDLKVIVHDDILGEVSVDATNLAAALERLDGEAAHESGKRIVELCESLQQLRDGLLPRFHVTSGGGAYQWSAANFGDAVTKELAASHVLDGKSCSFEVETTVPKRSKSSGTEVDRFEVLLVPCEGRGRGYFYRQGILITDAKADSLPGFNALVLIGEGPLATFLGDAEGPAHLDWADGRARVRLNYAPATAIKGAIGWVRNAPRNLIAELTKSASEIDLEAFSDIFPIPDDHGRRDIAKPGSSGERPGTPGSPPPGVRPPIRIGEVEGGFSVGRGDSTLSLVGRVFDVRVAYLMRRGNSFTNWHTSDFNLPDLRMQSAEDGVDVSFPEPNVVRIEILCDEWHAEFRGFGKLRDLDFHIAEVAR